MKKKFLIIMPIFIFALIFLAKTPIYATTYDKDFVEYTLPNQYEAGYTQNDPGDFYIEYSCPTSDGHYNELFISCGQWLEEPGFTPPSQEHIDWHKEFIVSSYQGQEDYETLNGEPEGKMIEVNGVPGYQVTYTTTESSGLVSSHGVFVLISDYTTLWFSVHGPGQYVFSNEVKNMVNSIKIKDTVLKAKGVPFTDVSKNDWFYNAVKYVYDNNIIKGYNDYTFAPNDKVTRGMIVTMLYRMEESPNNDGKSKFTDVNSSEWYAKAIKWAVDNGIVHGYGGTTKFGPNDNIIRQDLAGILRNYAKYKKKNVNVTADLTKFKDYKKVDSYANASVQWAVGKGVITGNADGTLNPKGNATRAEAAAMIQKYCNKVGR